MRAVEGRVPCRSYNYADEHVPEGTTECGKTVVVSLYSTTLLRSGC